MNEPGLLHKVGFLGTGLMGGPMAVNIMQAGFSVRAWNRNEAKVRDCGLKIAATPQDAVHDADIVVVMLSSGPVCEEVLFGENGAAKAMATGSLLVVMSSVGFEEAKTMAGWAGSMGLRWVDAPVSGGTPAAAAGTLSIMAGGTAADIAAARPVLDAMGRTVHIGPEGTGALAKLVNQLTVASTIVAVSESLLLAEAGGADPAKVREALLGGFAASRILDLHGARMISGNFDPGGPAKYQLKDTRAARQVAHSLGLELPALDLADKLFADLVANGGGDLDHSAIYLELKRKNGRLPADSPITSQLSH